MIDVTMRIDHGHHGLLRTMFVVELKCSLRDFSADQWINHDETAVAFDEGHVRQIEAAQLINALRHFVQTVGHVDTRLSPQAGVHGVGRGLFAQEFIALQRPRSATVGAQDGLVAKRFDQATLGVVKRLRVTHRQVGELRAIGGACRLSCVLRCDGCANACELGKGSVVHGHHQSARQVMQVFHGFLLFVSGRWRCHRRGRSALLHQARHTNYGSTTFLYKRHFI